MLKRWIFFWSCTLCSVVFGSFAGRAQEVIPPPGASYASTFAIVVDEDSYTACKAEVEAYRTMLVKEGLGAYIIFDRWKNPEAVKQELWKLYQQNHLEGAVFIGDIPIPMIRNAQHLTSAFKMDQGRFPRSESSVPSDRFYDDFHLKFDYMGRDSVKTNFFYYSLRYDSPQIINCSIYSGRIKPTQKGQEGYAQLAAYLKKAVAERAQPNYLDVLCSYTGEGSYSNSLAAWKDERVCLREQLPAAFANAQSAKFYLFYMEPYMKETVSNQLRRPELDLMLFHEHGMPERQYMTGAPIPGGYTDDYWEWAKRNIRDRLRSSERRGSKVEDVKKSLVATYGIDSTWWEGAFDPKVITDDSLEDVKRGILLDDVTAIAPNARFVIFDACYNGDFREQRYIAGEYIFALGKCVATFGNTVNVLQDKSAGDLLGMLGLGLRVGQWAQQVNILESHITGDPTFRFTPSGAFSIQLNNTDPVYWKKLLAKDQPADVQALALYKLFLLNAPEMSELLYNTYTQSPYYMVRLQCMHLLPYYGDNYYYETLKKAVYDPYEFIRRKAVNDMGRTGRAEFIPFLVDVYLTDELSERVAFNVLWVIDMFGTDEVRKQAQQAIAVSPFLWNKEAAWENLSKKLASRAEMGNNYVQALCDPSAKMGQRMFGVSFLRNNPYSLAVGDLLKVLKNPQEPLSLRIALAEALGWYVKSERRGEIVQACEELSRNVAQAPAGERALMEEAGKTANRLKEYMKNKEE